MYTYICKIIKVIDGDTIDVDIDLGFNIKLTNQRVRLASIDAPESRSTNKEEKQQGMLSKKKLEEKLPQGSMQTIQTVKVVDDDKFGRILGIFPLSDTLTVNQWMIDNNYAVFYTGENKDLIQEQHLFNRRKLIQLGELKL
jgi:micrococcal nuclease